MPVTTLDNGSGYRKRESAGGSLLRCQQGASNGANRVKTGPTRAATFTHPPVALPSPLLTGAAGPSGVAIPQLLLHPFDLPLTNFLTAGTLFVHGLASNAMVTGNRSRGLRGRRLSRESQEARLARLPQYSPHIPTHPHPRTPGSEPHSPRQAPVSRSLPFFIPPPFVALGARSYDAPKTGAHVRPRFAAAGTAALFTHRTPHHTHGCPYSAWLYDTAK